MNVFKFLKIKLLRNKKEKLNYEYAKGVWDGLSNLQELGRFSIIAGYLNFFNHKNYSILEFGCGQGLLYQRLHKEKIDHYEGVDMASDIIYKNNLELGSENVLFISADMDSYLNPKKFDYVIFNEALYYSKNYKVLLQRCQNMLKPNGCIILSINTGFKKINEYNEYLLTHYQLIDKTVIQNKYSYEITVIKPL